MKLRAFFQVVVPLAVAVTGIGVAASSLGRAASARPGAAALPDSTVPADTIRAWRLLGLVYPKPKVVVLPAANLGQPAWQLVKVRRVLDADTYEVQADAGLARVRVRQVDAPEHDQPFGPLATDSVRALVGNKYVLVRPVGADGYGRTLADVRLRASAFSVRPGRSLDSLLVVRGWAWAYAPSGQFVVRAREQQVAVAARRGLWKCGTSGVVRPGIWRAYNAQEKATARAGCAW